LSNVEVIGRFAENPSEPVLISASSIFNVPAPPQPVRMPLDVVLPEKMRITFCPRLAICASTCALAPLPMPTIAITAATPIMIPSAVSTERILFRRSARYATLNVGAIRIQFVEALKS